MILPDSKATLLPPLKLEGNDKHEAYTARSTLTANSEQELSWTKSVFFGKKLLDIAIVRHWSTKDPSLTVENLQVNHIAFFLPPGF